MSEGRYFKRITICRWVTPHFPRYPIAGAYAEFSLITGIGQGWKDVQVLDLETCSRPALRGNRPGTGASAYVLPCWLSENLSMSLYVVKSRVGLQDNVLRSLICHGQNQQRVRRHGRRVGTLHGYHCGGFVNRILQA